MFSSPPEPAASRHSYVWREDTAHSEKLCSPVLLVHGLMGRSTAWKPVVEWMPGPLYTYDAPHHRGHTNAVAEDITTEFFLDDLVHAIQWVSAQHEGAKVHLVGHSMGGLHSWCVAAQFPQLVASVVVEDMTPDFQGLTADGFTDFFQSWPTLFPHQHSFTEFFGPDAGTYFWRSFEETDGGWRLHGNMSTFTDIANHWGTRNYWDQWRQVSVPVLLMQAEHSIAPPTDFHVMEQINKMCTRVVVEDSTHIIHYSQPEKYRQLLTEWLRR